MTGTALQVHEAREVALASHSDVDYGGLLALAKELVPTGFLPDHIKTPGQAVAIILTGRELGMLPMRALRSLMMVKGKVTENADSQLARFKADGGHAKWITLDETKAVLWLRMRNGDEHTETFTYNDAERAGLTRPSQSGMPSMYVKHPKPMLRSRCITAGLKSIGWEGGTGTYDPDELAIVVPDSTPSAVESPRPAHITADGEDTREAASARTSRGAKPAREKRMPMGHNRGKLLGEMETKDLESAAKWCRENNKYPDLVSAIADVLAERQKDQGKLELEPKAAANPRPADDAAPPSKKEDASSASSAAAEKPRELPANRARWNAAQLQARALELLKHPKLPTSMFDAAMLAELNAGKLNHAELVNQVRRLEKWLEDAESFDEANDANDDDDLPF